jgi:hypothetical protein
LVDVLFSTRDNVSLRRLARLVENRSWGDRTA